MLPDSSVSVHLELSLIHISKKTMADKLAQIVYEGKWFTPLREAVQAFVESTQEYVTGEVKFKLYKGNIIKAGTTSPYSLYSESLASFTTGDLYDHCLLYTSRCV